MTLMSKHRNLQKMLLTCLKRYKNFIDFIIINYDLANDNFYMKLQYEISTLIFFVFDQIFITSFLVKLVIQGGDVIDKEASLDF